jgi:hypothetical protein
MLLSAQVLEEIRENLFEAEKKNLDLIKTKNFYCFTVVVTIAFCSFLNKHSSNAIFVWSRKKLINFCFIQNICLPLSNNLNGLQTTGVNGSLYIKKIFSKSIIKN